MIPVVETFDFVRGVLFGKIQGSKYTCCHEDFIHKRSVWREIDQEAADEVLCVLPPIYFVGGFAMSEPFDHTAAGVPLYYCVIRSKNGKHFMKIATVEAAQVAAKVLNMTEMR